MPSVSVVHIFISNIVKRVGGREVVTGGSSDDRKAAAISKSAVVRGVAASVAEVEADRWICQAVRSPSSTSGWAELLGSAHGSSVADLIDVEVEHGLSEDEQLFESFAGGSSCVRIDDFVAVGSRPLKDVGFDIWLLSDGDDVNFWCDGEEVAFEEAHAVLGADQWQEDVDVRLSDVLVNTVFE